MKGWLLQFSSNGCIVPCTHALMQLVVNARVHRLPCTHGACCTSLCQALLVVAVLYLGRFDATFALLRAKGVSLLQHLCGCCGSGGLLCLLWLLWVLCCWACCTRQDA